MSDTVTDSRERLEQAKRLLLEKRLRGEVKARAPRETIGRSGLAGPAYPMSYQQEQLWFLDRLQPGSPYYNIPGANLVSARIDVPTLERALTEVVRRHEAIRTVFRLVDGKPMQIVQPPYPIRVPVEEMRGPGGEPAPGEAVRRKASEWGALPFDLENGPLFRAMLYRVSDADYLLVFNIHHIVTDGWAMPIVTREMEEIYAAYSRGEPSPLPELDIQYADYAAWQRKHLSGPTLQKLVDYWKGHLEGAPTTLELPTDRPRPPVATNRGAIHRFVYPGALTERLRALGKEEHASVNMVFMAGFNLLLQRYSGQDDLVVGTLLGNRNRAELEPLVGYFVNSGAIRTRLDGDPTFRELVRQVRTSILDADAHQELPFDMVVDALKVPRDPARNPLFQAMYFHHTFVGSHHLDDEQAALAGALNLRSLYQEAEAVLVDTGASKFDMTWATLEMDSQMPGMVEYATDLFDDATIARMVAHLRVLLDEACARPDLPVSMLEMAGEDERRALLAWGTNERPYPRGETLASLFARRAAAAPGSTAAEFEDDTLTYRDLDERSNRVARYLAKLGVRPGTCVGLATENSARMVVGLAGIIKAGGTAVPLDPGYPADRLAFMVEDTRSAVIVTEGDALGWMADREGATVVRLDRDWPAIAHEPADAFASPAEPETVAYVIYTSGSTGTPKGVRVHHRAVVRTVVDVEYAPITAADRVAQQSSLSFDSSIWEIWGALLNGAALVNVSRDFILSPQGYADALKEKRIGIAFLTTQLFNQLVRDTPDVLASMKTVLFGGEKVDPGAVRACLAGTPPQTLLHVYGPTEATVYTTSHRVTHVPDDAVTVPIGRPIDNARVYVLSPGGTLAGVGVPGELFVGGDGVALGYLDRPELTAQRFLADPFVPGGTMYRTGDRVRWTEVRERESAKARKWNGDDDAREGEATLALSHSRTFALEFVGRMDDQVKVRGFRIELGEVENLLRRHPALRDAAVAAREDGGSERRLVGYVVPADAEPTAAELRGWMKDRLPEYMVPTVFVTLDALPVSPNGKVDRKRLPSPDARRLEAGDGYVAPRTPAEATLARIWADVLRVERIGVHDNFFALGGDSILSIQIVARAGEAGLRVQPRHVFMHQTIAELAAVAGLAGAPVAEQGIVAGPVPLTPVQRWFFDQRLPEPAHFNLTLLFQAGERIDAAALERACAAVVAHHDALRLRFERGAEGWEQVNAAPSHAPALDHVDLSALPAEEREAAFTARAEALQRSLELADGPLVRFALFDFGADQAQRLLIVAHHLVIDAVSWGFVAQDVETAYAQAARGEAVHLPRKTTSFRQWAERLAEHANSGEVRRQAPFWLRQTGVPALPVDGDPAANTEGEAERFAVELDEETTRALLTDVPPVYGTQVNDVLLAALARAFRRWTGERAMLVDLEGHGREDLFDGVDLSRTAGWFTAIHPVRVELSADGEPGDDLVAVKEQLRAVPEKGIGYGMLRWLSTDPEIPHALAALPPAQVSFNYLGRMDFGGSGDAIFRGMDAEVGAARGPAGRRTHLLGVDAAVSEGRLSITWTYGRRVHRAETVERLAAAFADELRAMVAHCRDPRAGGYTPSDFDLAGLDQAGLDALEVLRIDSIGRGNVEDVYPLSPLQEGMLFHALYSEGAYQEQFPLLLTGELDVDALERAFRAVVARHGALRTGFAWEGVPRPLQFVLRRADPAFDRLDWSGAGDDWRARFDALMEADRRRGHDLARPPLARMTVARMDGRRHVMLLSLHHMVIDGWSLPLVVGELDALYRAEHAGRAAALPPAPRYRDYVRWLMARDAGAAERFWRGALAGFHHATPLPLDRGPAAAGDERVKETVDADPALMERAQAFARAQGVTLNTLAQAAWGLLLARHAAEDDVVFGATVSGRPPEVAGVERTVGLFINTVPVRVRVDEPAPVGDWLRAIQHAQVESRAFEYARLVDVHGWSDVPREAPLFDSLLVFENYPVQMGGGAEGQAPPLKAESLPAPERTNYALTLICAPAPGAFQLRLTYDPARFTADAAGRILAGVQAALAALVEDAERAVGELAIVSAAERAELERWAHGPALEIGAGATLHGEFARHAGASPDAPAVDDGRVAWTYAGLDAVSRGLAARLAAQGVGAGSRVAVAMEPGAWRVAAMLAVVRTGAAYVPLDLAYPAERLAYMLDDSGAAALLADAEAPASLASFQGPTLRLPADADPATSTTIETFADAAVDGEAEAYVVYTSGSTGRPKGIAVPHRAVLRMAADPRWRCGPADRVAQVTGASFDPMAYEVWGALAAGAAVVPFDRETVLDAPAFARGLAGRGVTAMFLSTGLFNQVARAVPSAFNPLRYVIVGGEAVDAQAFRAVLQAGGPRLINGYGPAEAAVYAATHDVVSAEEIAEDAATVPIGRPIVGTVARVLDGRMRLLPAGAAGELCLGGPALAHGYVGQPALTAERFVPDPFSTEPGARLYRTGDRARWTEVRERERANVRTWNGGDDPREDAVTLSLSHARTFALEYLGRLDDQVKVRGYRVEPGEIVAVLRTHPAVAAAFVAARPDAAGAQRLVAWIVPSSASAVDVDALRAHLGKRLPEWMVPADWVFVDHLPLTANGKVDRAALPHPDGHASIDQYVEPRTETERELADVWREVLKAERVGAHDTFFALGGHSLLAMQLAARIHARLGVELPLRTLFDAPRLADMAARIDAAREAELAALLAEVEGMSDEEARALAAGTGEG